MKKNPSKINITTGYSERHTKRLLKRMADEREKRITTMPDPFHSYAASDPSSTQGISLPQIEVEEMEIKILDESDLYMDPHDLELQCDPVVVESFEEQPEEEDIPDDQITLASIRRFPLKRIFIKSTNDRLFPFP